MSWDPFLMKKLLKVKFVGPWIVHGCTILRRLGQQLRLKKKNAERGKCRCANALSKRSFNKQCFGYNFHKEYIGKSMVRRYSYSFLSHSCWVSIIKFRLKWWKTHSYMFHQNLFQSSNFVFFHSSPLTFNFIQLRLFHQIFLNVVASFSIFKIKKKNQLMSEKYFLDLFFTTKKQKQKTKNKKTKKKKQKTKTNKQTNKQNLTEMC